MRPPFARTAATTVALTLALAACSADSEGDATSSTASSSTAPTSESTSSSSRASSPSSSASAKVSGAPAALTRAVAQKYGDQPLDGRADLGDWRGAKVAVVTADPSGQERIRVLDAASGAPRGTLEIAPRE